MKLYQVGAIVAAVMLSASMVASTQSSAQSTTTEGQIQGISVSCSGKVPDTCAGRVDIAAGLGYGVTSVFIPEGVPIKYGSRQVPITFLETGDRVRIDYTTTNSTAANVNPVLNSAAAATLLTAAGGTNILPGGDHESNL